MPMFAKSAVAWFQDVCNELKNISFPEKKIWLSDC